MTLTPLDTTEFDPESNDPADRIAAAPPTAETGGASPPAARALAKPPDLVEPFRSLRLAAGVPKLESRSIFIVSPWYPRLRDSLDPRR